MPTMLAVVLPLALLILAPQSRDAAPTLAGTWRGVVTADIGEMQIVLTVTITKGVAAGTIDTGHGSFRIADGRLAAGKWTLPFESPEGATGRMIGVVKGDNFSGEWDFRPTALGMFSLTRQK